MRMRFLATLFLFLPLTACSQTWEETRPSAPPGGTGVLTSGEIAEGTYAVSSVSQLPARNTHGAIEPYGSKGTAAAYEFGTGYRVGAGDRMTIRVAGEADLSSEYLVDGAGNISMPYVQTIMVAGMTASQIENLVAQRLRDGYLRDPQVSVQVTTLRPFYILGEVNAAGSFPYQPGMTVQNAIAIAGGYGARADQKQVLVTRKNADGTATHKVPVTTQLYPGDIIYVRERWF
ncbi:MAG: polysaccharide export protein [Alphaproteobacteria bacterium]|nr:polysaccharide export protein [Alphaproteobacteria bacterium]